MREVRRLVCAGRSLGCVLTLLSLPPSLPLSLSCSLAAHHTSSLQRYRIRTYRCVASALLDPSVLPPPFKFPLPFPSIESLPPSLQSSLTPPPPVSRPPALLEAILFWKYEYSQLDVFHSRDLGHASVLHSFNFSSTTNHIAVLPPTTAPAPSRRLLPSPHR